MFQNIEVPAVQYLVVGFGTVSMFICVTMAFNQHNFKRLLAFHSISQVGGSDLFWGFKHNLRKYFSFMHDWHSGIVNDYALYGVVAIAFVLVFCVAFV